MWLTWVGDVGCLHLCPKGLFSPLKPGFGLKRRQDGPGLSWRGQRLGRAHWFDGFGEAWVVHSLSQCSWVAGSLGSEIGMIRLKSQFLNLLAMWPWASPLTFLIYKIMLLIVPTS